MKMPTRLTALLFASCCLTAAAAAPHYKITALGLDDLEHTATFGRDSLAGALNEAGQVSGISFRFNGGSTGLGRSAFFFDGASTINIGLVGPDYTRDDGHKFSNADHLNDAGQVAGVAERYAGDQLRGQSAWLYDGATTTEIGIAGPVFTRDDGYKHSVVLGLNEAGQVLGRVERYDSFFTGYTGWLYNGTTTIDVGLTGPEHTSGNGLRRTFPIALNEAGQVIGRSDRFNGGTLMGQSAFLFDGMTTHNVGLVGPGYTYDPEDIKVSDVVALNEAGQVAGYSQRFSGENAMGFSAFLYDGATTFDVSLIGAAQSRDDGYTDSQPSAINEAGQVVGIAKRYLGGNSELGQNAWLYDGVATIDVGLSGSEHTRDDGFEYSTAIGINNAGQVAGNSRRFGPGVDFGQSAWLYDGATTIEIGLDSPEHAGPDGYRFSDVVDLNEAGQAVGFTDRYIDGFYVGQDAWLYDPALGQTISLQVSVDSFFGDAYSSVQYLGEDGLVLGTYDRYDEFGFPEGRHAFYFTIADGIHDLGALVAGGLESNGWELLEGVRTANSGGQIFGIGRDATGNELPFLLTPVPEPGTNLLLLFAGVAVTSWRIRDEGVHGAHPQWQMRRRPRRHGG